MHKKKSFVFATLQQQPALLAYCQCTLSDFCLVHSPSARTCPCVAFTFCVYKYNSMCFQFLVAGLPMTSCKCTCTHDMHTCTCINNRMLVPQADGYSRDSVHEFLTQVAQENLLKSWRETMLNVHKQPSSLPTRRPVTSVSCMRSVLCTSLVT